MERYSNLYSSPLSVYTPGCPVCIAAGALLKDNQTGAILAQLKFKNISSREIAGLTVAVDAFDMGGSPLDGVPEYSYLDIKESRDAEFGQKKPILLPNMDTRRISARCTKVFFLDGGVWEAPMDAVWAPLGVPTTLESALGQELADQYRRDTIPSAQFIPLEQHDLWTCTCGTINRKEEGSCHSCSSLLSTLIAATNKDTLSAHLAEKMECDRIAAEKLAEEQRIAAEVAAVKKKKSLKISSIVAAVAVVCVAAFLVVTKVVIPSSDYKAAEALLAAGDYDGAIAAFTELGDYKDASDMVQVSHTAKLEAYYYEAEALFAEGKYDDAIAAFENAKGYSDATDRIPAVYYAKAETLLADENYDDAIAAFRKAKDYSDAADRIPAIYYTKAEVLLAEEDLAGAFLSFEAAGDYLDASVRQADALSSLYEEIDLLARTESPYTAILQLYQQLGFEHSASKGTELFQSIASWGWSFFAYLRSDGTLAAKITDYKATSDFGQLDVNRWTDVVAIDTGFFHTVGLRSDGTVVATGANGDGRCDVSQWNNIVDIAAGDYHTVGLRSDGTVLALGGFDYGESDVADWSDIVDIVAFNHFTVGLCSDGTVHYAGSTGYTNIDVSRWSDVVDITAGTHHIVGLRSNGTVLATGQNSKGQCDVSKWKNIVDVASGHNHTVGLRSDGTVVATGENNSGQCDVSNWTDIVAISVVGNTTVGLRADGTVVATGNNGNMQCIVSDWKDILAIATDGGTTYGLRSDGTVVSTSGEASIPASQVY